jgi:hypothetical protein
MAWRGDRGSLIDISGFMGILGSYMIGYGYIYIYIYIMWFNGIRMENIFIYICIYIYIMVCNAIIR